MFFKIKQLIIALLLQLDLPLYGSDSLPKYIFYQAHTDLLDVLNIHIPADAVCVCVFISLNSQRYSDCNNDLMVNFSDSNAPFIDSFRHPRHRKIFASKIEGSRSIVFYSSHLVNNIQRASNRSKKALSLPP